MIDRVQIIADIIEPALSGQYGRDVAEELAQECVDALDLKHPKKWQGGHRLSGEDHWNGCCFYAANEQEALEMFKKGDYYPAMAIVKLIHE